MSDAVWFIVIFVGFFLLRLVIATMVFYWMLPAGDRCPNCDAVTLHVQSKAWNRLMPWFRTSWCYRCNWEGFLRYGPLTRETPARELTKQP
ncbi:MAG TPA: hypothetical protein VFK13_03605 [Gemmatimonadaceae bacterium]|nr:hypothetical protein [Gemmatimonadaceae bacterium]